MDVNEIKQIVDEERKRSTELTILLSELAKATHEAKEPIIKNIDNKIQRSCGDETGIKGLPILFDILFPSNYSGEDFAPTKDKPVSLEEIGTSIQELFNLSRILVSAHLSMVYRKNIAYQIDLASKGYTGEEASDLAFYLSRKETFYPWYRTPGTKLRRFVTIFDMFDVNAEDVGIKSEAVHAEVVKFYQIWLRFLSRREWDALVRHIISDRWPDHGRIGMLVSRLSPLEIDPTLMTLLNPDGSARDEETKGIISKKFGMFFEGNNLQRLSYEASSTDDQVRVRQLRYVRHVGRLNPHPHPSFHSLLWGAEATKK